MSEYVSTYHKFQTLFRVTLSYIPLSHNKFLGKFVYLHQNSKSKEIMPEICHFYGIVMTIYLPSQ